MSNLSHTIRHFNRFELKYMITLQQAEMIKKNLENYLKPDTYGDDNGHYSINSLYFDSPDYRCYWEKMDGIRFRRKLRIRHYDDGQELNDQTPVFVEIKQRIDRVTHKRRIILPYKEAVALCNARELPLVVNKEQENTISEIYSFIWQYNLRPTSIIRYHRQALIGNDYDIGLRITFDTQLYSQQSPLQLNDLSAVLQMFSPELVIMEIKVNERIPYWLTELVAQHNLQMIRISKYCRSIDQSNVFPSFSLNYLRSMNY